MKTILYLTLLLLTISPLNYGQANTTLSNLTPPTAVNQELLPNGNNIRSLGSSAKSWRMLYLDSGIYLKDVLFVQSRGIQNTFVGQQSGNSFTTARNNTALGYQSLFSVTTGSYSTANGADALYSNTSGYNNTAVGYATLYKNTTGFSNTATGTDVLYSNTTGSYNTAYGDKALFSNTTTQYNTAIGYGSLYKNTGNYNTATGFDALYSNTGGGNSAYGANSLFSNTIGYCNTATGFDALYTNVSGNENTANGCHALYYNTTGYRNTASGSYSLYYNTTGYDNTASGYRSLYSNLSGSFNTALGENSLSNNAGGHYNTAIGERALYSNDNDGNTALGCLALDLNYGGYNTADGYGALNSNTFGNDNTAIGSNSDVSSGKFSNATALGHGAIVNASNKVRIGDQYVTVVESQVGSWTTSDGRFKNNIKENVKGLEFIKLLKPVTYNFDTKKFSEFLMQNYPDSIKKKRLEEMDKNATEKASAIIQSGFIAQDVAEAAKKSGYNFNGVHSPENPTDNWSLSYEKLVVPLVKAVQELDAKNQELENKVEQLTQLVQTLIQNKSLIGGSSYLSQNIPNPSKGTTIIPYQVATGSHAAAIQIIETGSGKIIKTVSVDVKSKQTTLNTNSLAAGSYMYALIVDGKQADSKQMLIK